MKYAYPVIFTRTEDEKDTILIEVPDLEIMTEGFGVADAIEMARDAIGLAGISIEDNKEKMPQPSSQSTAMEMASKGTEYVDFSKGILTYVDVDFSEYRRKIDTKTVRRNVALPSWLNYEAEHAGINVSRVLQEALMSVLNVQRNL